MLRAAEFDQINTPIISLYQEFTEDIILDMALRIRKLKGVTSATAWQMQRLQESGGVYEYVITKLSTLTGRSESALKQAFLDAGVRTLEFDDTIYKTMGLKPLPLKFDKAMLAVLQIGLEKTAGKMRNLVSTTALITSQEFLEAFDLAYMAVSSGAMDYNSAIKTAIKKIAADGISVVDYPTGHKDKIDVAVRRAVLTGVSQTAGRLQLKRAADMGQDLVQTSAHFGARNIGKAPENHEEWQGRVFSLTGTGYPNFYEVTGYGTGEGLHGWNCRHSFYPFYEGLSVNPYSQEELDLMKNEKVTYQGKKISQYKASQIQRSIERTIRAYKRQAAALGAAGIDNTKEIGKVREWQSRMRAFVEETGLPRQRVREGGRVYIYRKPAPIIKPEVIKSPAAKKPVTSIEPVIINSPDPEPISNPIDLGELGSLQPEINQPSESLHRGTELMNKWQENIPPEKIEKIKQKTLEDMLGTRDYADMTPQERQTYLDHAESIIKRVISNDENWVSIAADGYSGQKIIESGRFKSQFETQHSNGLYAPGYRKDIEYEIFGAPKGIPASERVIYGALQNGQRTTTGDQYGNWEFVLNKNVLQRATFTATDSLQLGHVGTPITNPSLASFRSAHYYKKFISGEWDQLPYVEVQLYGQVTLMDVEKLIYYAENDSGVNEIIDLLNKHGYDHIKVEYRRLTER